MKHYPLKNFIGAFAMLCIGSLSCTRDKVADTNSPAFHIAESESLLIPSSIDVPSNLPSGNTRVATFYADGVQKYKSKEIAGTVPAQYEWTFVAPQANLYDQNNKKVGTHSAGPTWQLIGSTTDSIYGQAFTPAKTVPSADANSIDWLLLMPKTGKAPTGIFTNVAYVQRIATNGGKAPLTAPAGPNDSIAVHYTAVYRFTKKNP